MSVEEFLDFMHYTAVFVHDKYTSNMRHVMTMLPMTLLHLMYTRWSKKVSHHHIIT